MAKEVVALGQTSLRTPRGSSGHLTANKVGEALKPWSNKHVSDKKNQSRFSGRECDEALFSVKKKGFFSEKGGGNSVN